MTKENICKLVANILENKSVAEIGIIKDKNNNPVDIYVVELEEAKLTIDDLVDIQCMANDLDCEIETLLREESSLDGTTETLWKIGESTQHDNVFTNCKRRLSLLQSK